MNWDQFKCICSTCYLCAVGSVVTLLYATGLVADWNNLYNCRYFLLLNSTNAVKMFKKNSNELFAFIFTLAHFWTTAQRWIKYYQGGNLELHKCQIIIREYKGKYKNLINLMILTMKRFICVTMFLRHLKPNKLY